METKMLLLVKTYKLNWGIFLTNLEARLASFKISCFEYLNIPSFSFRDGYKSELSNWKFNITNELETVEQLFTSINRLSPHKNDEALCCQYLFFLQVRLDRHEIEYTKHIFLFLFLRRNHIMANDSFFKQLKSTFVQFMIYLIGLISFLNFLVAIAWK